MEFALETIIDAVQEDDFIDGVAKLKDSSLKVEKKGGMFKLTIKVNTYREGIAFIRMFNDVYSLVYFLKNNYSYVATTLNNTLTIVNYHVLEVF